MMRRSIAALAGTLLTGAFLIGMSSPAGADTVVETYCELQHSPTSHLVLTASAYYVDEDDSDLRRWTQFRYRLSTTGSFDRDKNNVNIRLSESGRQVYAWNSPDNRKTGVTYVHVPSDPVYTSSWGPSGEHDHRRNDLIEFEGIFDLPQAADPRCTAWKLA
jgi:hypothetical protein